MQIFADMPDYSRYVPLIICWGMGAVHFPQVLRYADQPLCWGMGVHLCALNSSYSYVDSRYAAGYGCCSLHIYNYLTTSLCIDYSHARVWLLSTLSSVLKCSVMQAIATMLGYTCCSHCHVLLAAQLYIYNWSRFIGQLRLHACLIRWNAQSCFIVINMNWTPVFRRCDGYFVSIHSLLYPLRRCANHGISPKVGTLSNWPQHAEKHGLESKGPQPEASAVSQANSAMFIIR